MERAEIIRALVDIREGVPPLSEAALGEVRRRWLAQAGGGTMIEFGLGILVGIGICLIVYAIYRLMEDV